MFAGGAARTKTRDPNPIQQFQLSYRKLYGLVNSIDWGFNFELGLTGNKIQATAAALLSAVLPINEVWYVAPEGFDASRFTHGVGPTSIYRLGRRPLSA